MKSQNVMGNSFLWWKKIFLVEKNRKTQIFFLSQISVLQLPMGK